MRSKEEILQDLAEAVTNMDEEKARNVAREAIEAGVPAYEAINEGLVKGMQVVGEKYEQQEYFVPEVLLCSDAMIAGLEILQPHLPRESNKVAEKVVIGVVRGDTHDIGKNLVKIMLEAAGFEVYDLGRNVPLKDFIEKAVEVEAKVIAMSTLMTTTMDGMREVIEDLTQL